MPNIKSAKKRMRQNVEHRLHNRSWRSMMRTQVKKFRAMVEAGELDEARKMLASVYAVIDKTAQKNVIHRNTAARYKSRLTRLLNVESAAND